MGRERGALGGERGDHDLESRVVRLTDRVAWAGANGWRWEHAQHGRVGGPTGGSRRREWRVQSRESDDGGVADSQSRQQRLGGDMRAQPFALGRL
jgi:hypothetical protein